MPTTVTDNTGVSRPLWQLPDLSAPEPVDSKTFTTLENEMSEGYFSSLLLGLNTGIKSWKLTCPTLAGATVIAAAVTDPLGATVSRAQYVRNLHKWNMNTGQPFVYTDQNANGQYYMVDFVDNQLTLKEKTKGIDIYETSFAIQQRRINGITVFDVSKIFSSIDSKVPSSWLVGSNFSSPTWTSTPIGASGTATGDVAKISAAQNGQDVVRIDGSAATGYVSIGLTTLYEVFIVMKMREATFSTNAGIFTGSAVAALKGASGGTVFANQSYGTGYEYRLNGVSYAESNQQAPMNAWGIVHVRFPAGFSMGGTAALGKNVGSKSVRSNVDFGEVIVCANPNSLDVSREITEYLSNKWAVTI